MKSLSVQFLIVSLAMCSLAQQETGGLQNFDTRIVARNTKGSEMYALVLTNNGEKTVKFQALTDMAYQHLACTYNALFPFTRYYGDPKDQWNLSQLLLAASKLPVSEVTRQRLSF
jgi:hypothetical protein